MMNNQSPLSGLVNDATAAVTATALEERHRFEIEILEEISAAVASSHEVETTLRMILYSTLGFFGLTQGVVVLYNREQQTLDILASKGLHLPMEPPAHPLTGTLARLPFPSLSNLELLPQKPCRLGALQGSAPPECERVARLLQGSPLESLCPSGVFVPLARGQLPVGFLLLGPKITGEPFDSGDLRLFEIIAAHTSIALRNAYQRQQQQVLLEHLDRRAFHLLTLFEGSSDLFNVRYQEEMFNQLLYTAMGHLGVAAGVICARSPQGDTLYCPRAKGSAFQGWEGRQWPADSSWPRILMERCDPAEESSFWTSLDKHESTAPAATYVPFLFKERLNGFFLLGPKITGTPLSEDEREFLAILGNQAAVAIENLCLIEQIKAEEIRRDHLLRYFSPAIAQEILSQDSSTMLQSRRAWITILVADIRGFSSLAEAMDPQKVVQLVNHYLGLIAEEVFAHHGALDKFIGDAAMALFGAPFPRQDSAELAARAALSIQRRLQQSQRSAEVPISLGIGLSTGEAVVGNIGGERRLEYTAIGETVNTAFRLEKLARAGEILVSANTYEKLKDTFRLSPLPRVKFKGYRRTQTIYRLERELDGA